MTVVVSKQERKVAINPTRSCAPIGSMIAAFGIHGSITINHGSQGCATYPRHQMARHFREPIEVATTSLTEKTTVYGGKENLLAALKNVWERFHPEMITICSTCLSETIGDDVPAIIEEFENENPDITIPILSVRTPSYIGTHITGFDNFLKELVNQVPTRQRGKRTAENSNGKVNILPGWVNPGDIRELKALVHDMDVPATFVSDYSDTLDGGYYQPRPHFPHGGTTVEELRDSSNALAAISLQKHIGGDAAKLYKKRHNMPAHVLSMPIGLHNTDAFVETLSEISGKPIPASVEMDRARLLDAIVDTHMFNSGLKVAIYGDPDMVAALVRLVTEMGMIPKYALTASESRQWCDDMVAMGEELGLDELEVMHHSDMHELHKRMAKDPVSLLIGHSKGKYLADDHKIPLVRVGFPIEDRFGYHRRSIVGYRGSIALVDEITNALLTHKTVVSNTVIEETALGPTLQTMPANGNGGQMIQLGDPGDFDISMMGGCGGGGGGCGG
jgi:nitrogenase molybdenum-iron protein beta chain